MAVFIAKMLFFSVESQSDKLCEKVRFIVRVAAFEMRLFFYAFYKALKTENLYLPVYSIDEMGWKETRYDKKG